MQTALKLQCPEHVLTRVYAVDIALANHGWLGKEKMCPIITCSQLGQNVSMAHHDWTLLSLNW